jgi:5S rRNA maturation endonuclease (ribonuclease M5)
MTISKYNIIATERVFSLLEKLNIEYKVFGDNIKLKCPIHGSNSINKSSIKLPNGIWSCWSNNCSDRYEKSVFGLVKGTLEKHYGKKISDGQVLKFIKEDTKIDREDIKKAIQQSSTEEIQYCEPLNNISVPSQYFTIVRKFRESTLVKFAVGDCFTYPEQDRAIVPFEDLNGKYMGYVARSHFNQCNKCGQYHNPNKNCVKFSPKWRAQKGCQKSKTLYNIHRVEGFRKVIIVEGVSCVWRLDQLGMPAVACLGGDFNENRAKMLKNMGVSKVLLAYDNDEAGESFKQSFVKRFMHDFSIFAPKLHKKDIDSMTDKEIEKVILPTWKKI